jgi:essential nuclear protein 1
LQVSPEEEAAMAAFLAPGASEFKQKSLADIIMAKIREKQEQQGLAAVPRCAGRSSCGLAPC